MNGIIMAVATNLNRRTMNKAAKLYLALMLIWPTARSQAADFHGYPCTQDCSGHEAGYEWAETNDITDPEDCGGNSNSFIEGCQAYAEEMGEEEEEDSEDSEDEEDEENW